MSNRLVKFIVLPAILLSPALAVSQSSSAAVASPAAQAQIDALQQAVKLRDTGLSPSLLPVRSD